MIGFCVYLWSKALRPRANCPFVSLQAKVLLLVLFPPHIFLSESSIIFLQYTVNMIRNKLWKQSKEQWENTKTVWFREVLQHFTPEIKKKKILLIDWSTNVCNALLYFGFVWVGGINMPQKNCQAATDGQSTWTNVKVSGLQRLQP